MTTRVGQLQQHLRLNVRSITTFTEALEILYRYIKSRHLTVPTGRVDHQVQADMDLGALKGKQGRWKGNGHKGRKGMQRKLSNHWFHWCKRMVHPWATIAALGMGCMRMKL